MKVNSFSSHRLIAFVAAAFALSAITSSFAQTTVWAPPPVPECPDRGTVRFENVERIFMEQPGVFAMMIRRTGTDEFVLKRTSGNHVRIFVDVPANAPMYVIQRTCVTSGAFTLEQRLLEIHLRSPMNLEGAGWQQRSGRITHYGSTQVLE